MDEGTDSAMDSSHERTIVDDWLEPLGDPPCGEDLEYDNDFLELVQAAAGKPETQFSEAEPPNWREVRERAETLFGRTRDIRIGLYWMRAGLHLDGLPALAEGLRLTRGLLENHWDDAHPKPDPDDGDPYARLNAVAELADADKVLADVRQALVLSDRSIGEIRVRDIEIALDRLSPREDESPLSRGQIEQMLTAAVESDAALSGLPGRISEQLDALTSLLQDKAGYDRTPDFGPLADMIRVVAQVTPSPAGESGGFDFGTDDSGDSEDSSSSFGSPRGGRGSFSGGIDSRDDALRAIDLICDFLERTEPTNPAQLLLRRARRLINKNFLELVQELAPDAVAEVAKIMGVDPATLGVDSSSSSDSSSSGDSSW